MRIFIHNSTENNVYSRWEHTWFIVNNYKSHNYKSHNYEIT